MSWVELGAQESVMCPKDKSSVKAGVGKPGVGSLYVVVGQKQTL